MLVPIRPLLAVVLCLLSDLAISSAQFSFLTPDAMTEWTAGQDATVSWKSNCSDPATTLFPVNLVDLDYDDVDVPIPGPPVFHVNCIPTGSLTIKVPIAINVPGVKTQGFYHFVVFYGQARYSSQLFDIKNSSPSGTPTTTSIPINRASTSAVATTITVSSSAPKSPNSTGPLSRDSSGNGTVGNGAAIGGGIAGGVAGGVALATIILLLVLRKRQQRKHQPKPEADPPPDHVLPSIEKTRDDGEYGGYLQTEPSNKSRWVIPHTVGPHNTPSSPHSFQETNLSPVPMSFSSPPLMPSRSISSLNPQDHGQDVQQRHEFRQEQLASRRSPQYTSMGSPVQNFSSLRSPENTSGTALISNYELQQQINLLHTELNRLQTKLDSSI